MKTIKRLTGHFLPNPERFSNPGKNKGRIYSYEYLFSVQETGQKENKARKMTEKRSNKDRRVNKNRRKGGSSSYSGPERRAIKDQRSGSDRRKTNPHLKGQ